MQNNQKLQAEEWISKASEDEANAKSILTHRDGTPSGTCFLSQQMAEKYLKGLLIFYKKEFPKIHDLIALETLLLEVVSEIKDLHDDIKLLNRYYIETRYPGDYAEFSWQDAEEAFGSATKIKEFVLKKIKASINKFQN